MPSYRYRREIPPGALNESLAAVKVRLVLELAQRTEERVKYWQQRENWCRGRPGRKLIIGWDTIPVFALETIPTNGSSSCVETPD